MSGKDEEGEILKRFEDDNELLELTNKSSKSESIMGSRVPNSITKKNKVIWTTDLHNKFLEAIEKLGIDRAVPTKIIDLMKVDGLTRDHVASHLQKYRVFSKKIAEANYRDQIASQPVLLESSMSNIGARLTPMPVQNGWTFYSEINPPILDTSSFSNFPVLEESTSTTANPSQPPNSSSLPNQGSSMQETTILEHTMPRSLDGQGFLIDDGAELGIGNSVNSSNSGFMHGFIYEYGGSYNDIEMGSSGDRLSYNELSTSCPTNTANSGNSSYMQNSNGFESNYSSESKSVEMCPLYDSNLNKEPLSSWNDDENEMEMNTDLDTNLEIGIEEDDLVLDEADIVTLWETFISEEPYVDHHGEFGSTCNNPPAILEPSDQDVNGEKFPNIVSFDSNSNEYHAIKQQLTNEETAVIDKQQCLDGYHPGFDPTFNIVSTPLRSYDIDEQLLLESRPEPLQDPFWNPFDQD